MSGSNREYPVGVERLQFDADKYKAFNKSPVISAEFSVASTGTTQAIEVPAGAYVYKVALLAVGAIATADIDVGDGVSTDRFIDGLTTLADGDMAIAPNVATGAAADEVGGHYYASNDTIDVKVNASSTAGSGKLLVWYTMT
jgi:hypothetical protein